MADQALKATQLMDLRVRAASRLKSTDAAKESTTRATHSMAVLHALASSPATAADALAVLHELQVHQVEVDLQAEELRESRAELEAALRRQMELYDFMPVACFAIDRHFVIRELNQAGTRMLGVDHEEACGLGLDTFVAADSLDALRRLVADDGVAGHACSNLRWRGARGSEQWVRAEAGHDPSGQGYFVALIKLEGVKAPGTSRSPA
jgi:PAS domain S-box-containing protein